MITLSVSSINFNKVLVNESSIKTFTIFNTYTHSVSIIISSSIPQYAVNFVSFVIPANGSKQISVTFLPDSMTTFSGVLTIHNVTDINDVYLNLIGVGTRPEIEVVPTNIDFSNVSILDTKKINVTIKNKSIDSVLKVTNIVSSNFLFSAMPTNLIINPSTQKTTSISFSPLVVGSQTGILTIQNNSFNNPNIQVTAIANAEIPNLTLDQTNLNFTNVTINQSSTKNVIVTNTSIDTIRVLISSVSTTNIKFKESVLTFILEKSQSLNIPVTFVPTDTSVQTGILNIQSNAGLHQVSLNGQGILASIISSNISSLNFGKSLVNISITKKIKITNSGLISLNIFSLISSSSKFVVTPISGVISPSSYIEFNITYTPNSPVLDSSSLTITSDDPNTPILIISLLGEGLTPNISAPTSLTFGKVSLNSTKTQLLRIINSSNIQLAIFDIVSANSQFSVSETFPLVINGGSSKDVVVSFLPTTIGTISTTLTINSNDFNHQFLVVQLSGEGNVPNIVVSPSTLDFSYILVGSSFEIQVFISNTGITDLNISSITSTNSLFSIDINSLVIQPQTTKSIIVTFSPIAIGAQTGTIHLINNDPDSPDLEVSVTGTGAVPEIDVDQNDINFGSVGLQDSKIYQLSIINRGDVDLDILIGVNPSVFTVDSTSLIIPKNTTEILQITFRPIAISSYTGQLTLTTNDPSQQTIQITLLGSGVNVPIAKVNVTSIFFGETKLGSTSTKVFSLRNDGTLDLNYTIQVNNQIFSVNTLDGTLLPHTNKIINVSFSPEQVINYSGTLAISSNDVNHNPIDIALSGSAVPGVLLWQPFNLEQIIPEGMQEIAKEISDKISIISDVLTVIKSILNIIKVFIIDIADPLQAILKAIQLLVTKLINDLSGTGIYFLVIFPGDPRISVLKTPQFYKNAMIDLTNPNLPQQLKTKYSDEIKNRTVAIAADDEDKQLIFGTSFGFDAFDSIKGGSAAFISKIIYSFNDAGDSQRPQFSFNAITGAIILACDSGNITDLLNAVKKISNIFKIEYKAQFKPPTNLSAIPGNQKITLNFSANNGLLSNAFIIWRSEVAGGDPVKQDPQPVDPNTKRTQDVYKINDLGRIVTSYKLVKILTLRDLLAEILKISKEETDSLIVNSMGYIDGLLSNLKQFFGMKFLYEDTKLTNDTSYFYTISAVSVQNPDDTSSITNKLKTSDQLEYILRADGSVEREFDPQAIGLVAWGTMSSEVSASPRASIDVVEGGLARCRNYRCMNDYQFTDILQVKTQGQELIKSFTNKPITGSVEVVLKRKTEEVTIPKQDYVVDIATITFSRTNFFLIGDEIQINYRYRKFKTTAVGGQIGEVHSITTSELTTIIVLDKKPIEASSVKIKGGLVDYSYEVIDDLNAKVKITFSNLTNIIIPFNLVAFYNYYEVNGEENFRCINPEFNKYFFDANKCNSGTTLCNGYENRNCFFNDGEKCTNEQISIRKILTVDENNKKHYNPENLPFKDFWDPFYCQNGMMIQRCDGYSKVDPRSGYKGVPPDWTSKTVIDLFPDIKRAIQYMDDLIKSLLAGTDKMSSTILSFIDLLEKKIDSLQQMINQIQSILDMISQNFSGPGFYLLNIPPKVGGNDYLIKSIQYSKNGPFSDALGYTAGVVLAYGGPDAIVTWNSLKLLF